MKVFLIYNVNDAGYKGDLRIIATLEELKHLCGAKFAERLDKVKIGDSIMTATSIFVRGEDRNDLKDPNVIRASDCGIKPTDKSGVVVVNCNE